MILCVQFVRSRQNHLFGETTKSFSFSKTKITFSFLLSADTQLNFLSGLFHFICPGYQMHGVENKPEEM